MTELTTTHEQAIRARLAAATEGPWAAWTDQDGTPHMGGMLMVGVAVGVIPDGETWVEGADVNNPVAHTYTSEDRELIANAPADLAVLLAELDRLRGECQRLANETKHPAWANITDDPGGAAIERMARVLADLEPGEPWPTNEELGGGPTGTRDDEYRHECMDRARAALAALLGGEQS